MKLRVALAWLPIAALTLSACESSSPTPPSNADVSGTWIGQQTVTSVTGGECLAATLQGFVGVQSQFRANLTQSGSTVTGTLDIDHTGSVCAYTGSVSGSVLVLNSTTCTRADTMELRCPGGGVRDLQVESLSLRATVVGNRMTGTAIETDSVLLSGATTSVGTFEANSSFTLTRQ